MPRVRITELSRPLVTGLAFGIGLLLAAGLALTVVSLSTVLMSIVLALFLALGLDPAVRVMQGWGMRRPVAIAAVAIGFLLLVVVIVLFVIPSTVRQFGELVQAVPATLDRIESSDWFVSVEQTLQIDLPAFVRSALASVTSLSSFLAISGGVL